MWCCPTWRRRPPATAPPITCAPWRCWKPRSIWRKRCWPRAALLSARSSKAAPPAICSPASSSALPKCATSSRRPRARNRSSSMWWRWAFAASIRSGQEDARFMQILIFALAVAAAANAAPAHPSPRNSADARLQAIYTSEWKWRKEQFPDQEDPAKPIEPRLPRVDPAAQDARLRYWQDVLRRLDGIAPAQLSTEEQINYAVYRPEIEQAIADQNFRDYEMPANSDSAFWTDFDYTARRPFRSLTDYRNWIAQMRDIPRYFREQVAEMRAGLKRGFTPPRVTMQGRDASIAGVVKAKPEATLFYEPFRNFIPGIPASEQAALRAEALKTIREQVQPAYAALLTFVRDDYIPHMRATLAAYDLPDGKAYYRQKIREFTTLDMDPDAIHKLGLSEVARLHQQMIGVMRETGFKGDFPAFLHYLRTDPKF